MNYLSPALRLALLAHALMCLELHRHMGLTFLQPKIRDEKVTLPMDKRLESRF